MKIKGLNSQEVNESRQLHGTNALTQIPQEPLWKKFLCGFKDPMIMILIVAFAVQMVLVFMHQSEWYEPVGILIAIIIANGVSSISESSQQSKASALKAAEEAKDITKVIREGKLQEIHVSDVVVGDIVFLQAGDKIPADGVIIEGEIKVDQAALNGETDEATKRPCSSSQTSYNKRDLLNEHYAYRGTVVCGSEAYMRVEEIGDKTLFGELALQVQEETRKTPLQVKLSKLAGQIAKVGYICATAIALGIIGKTLFSSSMPHDVYEWIRLVIDAITIAVTIIVCAVPEGLPMLTSILLSLQSLKMAKDNVLVRKLNGLETTGSLSLLFSDKTGTITEGRLRVVEIVTGNVVAFTSLNQMPKVMADDFITGVGVNNSASSSGDDVIGGNNTDRALMSFLVAEKVTNKIDKSNVKSFNAFDSAKKYSSITLCNNDEHITYIKGAPEKILANCTSYIDEKGNVCPLASIEAITAYIDAQAARSMRLLAVAKANGLRDDKDLTLVNIICIRDNVRKEAVEAIRQVQNAGIQVVMITGDRKETAVAIAKDAGLLVNPQDIAITSAELAQKTDDEIKQIIRNIRVVARALPTDKSRLVRIAQEMNLVVGMTGDGVNDSPALKKADVGFAMGSGTEVAKEAGDITILDDNFLSIKKAILYGRTMFKSIRKFLTFQLTVNVAAVLTCFMGPMLGQNVVMTVIQLLLVNLAMDTLVAIAFGSEPALDEYMNEKPVPRTESIVTKEMFGQIIVGAIYITTICLAILFVPAVHKIIGTSDIAYLKTALFATFMMSITFNGFNARTSSINLFKGISRNKNFIFVMAGILALQYAFITYGGEMLNVRPLSWHTWGITAALAALVIPIDLIRKLITPKRH